MRASIVTLLCLCGPVIAADFEKLALEKPARHFTVSEDGRFALVAHEEDNFVSVWNLQTGASVAKVDCPSPRFILSRGNQSYVATYAAGNLHIVSHDNWKVSKTINTGFSNLFYLSAPQLEYFKSSVLATCNTDERDVMNVLWIDVDKAKTFKLLRRPGMSLANVDYKGEKYFLQGPFRYSGSIEAVYEFSQLEAKFQRIDSPRESNDITRLYQVRPGSRWFGRKHLHLGMPPRRGGVRLAEVVIPDQNRDVIYLFDEGNVFCHALDMPLTKLGQQILPTPPFTRPHDEMSLSKRREHSWLEAMYYVPARPVAMTIGDSLHIWAMDLLKGDVVRVKLPAFDLLDGVAANVKSNLAKAANFPAKIPAKREFVFPLFGHMIRGKYKITNYRNAKNISIDENGVIRWTPTDDQMGEHQIGVTSDERNAKLSLRIKTEVVDAALLPAELGGTGEGAYFSKVLPGKISSYALTEDRKHLLITQFEEQKVVVWSLADEKVETTFTSSSPRHVIHRGDKAYVANYGRGTISVHSGKDNWKIVNQLQVGSSNVAFLSAPQGRFFDGKIMTSSAPPRSRVQLSVVDERKDTYKLINQREDGFGVVSYDGKVFVKQVPRSYGGNQTYDFSGDYALGKPLWTGSDQPYTIRRQVLPGTTWFAENSIVRDGKSNPVPDRTFVVPDVNRYIYYHFDKSTIQCIALDSASTNLGTRRWGDPRGSSRLRSRPSIAAHPLDFGQHLAATIDDRLHLFYYDRESRELFHAKVAAIPTRVLIEADAAHQNRGQNAFPRSIGVGEKKSYQLFGKEVAAQYEVVSGPKGVTASGQGLLTWTPAQEDVGEVSIKVRASQGKDFVFVRLSTKVVQSFTAPSPTTPIAGGTPGRHVFPRSSLRISYDFDGQSMLVLHNQTLTVLDREGMKVKKQYPLTQRYEWIFSRKDYFVAASLRTIDLLARDTGKVTKTIPLETHRSFVALHPTKPLSYVSAQMSGRDIRSSPVFEINELTGKATKLGRVFGSGISIDPKGRYLFTSARRHEPPSAQGNEQRSVRQNGAMLLCYSLGEGGQDVRHIATKAIDGARNTYAMMAPHGRQFLMLHDKVIDASRPSFNLSLYNTDLFDGDPVVKLALENQPYGFALHPTLNLMAIMDREKLMLFDSITGKLLPDLVKVPAGLLRSQPIIFAPSGTHLLVTLYEPQSKQTILQSFPLNLTDEQQGENGNGFQQPTPVPLVKRPNDKSEAARREYSPRQLDSLFGNAGAEMPIKEIAQAYANAVAVVRSESTNGLGLVIGKSGYVLTLASVLPPFGDVAVLCQTDVNGQTSVQELPATIVRVGQQLALLKVDTQKPLTSVSMANPNEAEAADDVVVISCPDSSQTQLSHSIERGYVRNVGKYINDQPFLQTSIQPSPSMLGAPVFSSRGRVVGIAINSPPNSVRTTNKANLLAVPTNSIFAFLGAEETIDNVARDRPRYRTWSDPSGQYKVEAKMIRVEDGHVLLQKTDGATIKVPLSRLSKVDQHFIQNASSTP